ncbi:MAG: hypothetical protein F6K26_27595 [Moorea sp. SIO2I5]|nr:hypothetical protein [Moorena sp. SIO2I5]
MQKYFFDTVSLAVGHATRTILLQYSPFPFSHSRQLPRSLIKSMISDPVGYS